MTRNLIFHSPYMGVSKTSCIVCTSFVLDWTPFYSFALQTRKVTGVCLYVQGVLELIERRTSKLFILLLNLMKGS